MPKNRNNKFFINTILIALILIMPYLNLSYFSCSAAETFYDFSDEAQAQFDMQNPIQSPMPNAIQSPIQNPMLNTMQKPPVLMQYPSPNINTNSNIVYVPAGSSFQAVLQSPISSQSLMQHDTIAGIVDADWHQDNVLLAPKGSIVYGKAVDTKRAGRAYTNGKLSITFNEILTPKGSYINLVTNTVVISVEDKNRPLKITADVANGTLSGFMTPTSRSMALTAAIGAIDGLLTSFTRNGEEVEIPAGTGITVRLIQAMNIAPYK